MIPSDEVEEKDEITKIHQFKFLKANKEISKLLIF